MHARTASGRNRREPPSFTDSKRPLPISWYNFDFLQPRAAHTSCVSMSGSTSGWRLDSTVEKPYDRRRSMSRAKVWTRMCEFHPHYYADESHAHRYNSIIRLRSRIVKDETQGRATDGDG